MPAHRYRPPVVRQPWLDLARGLAVFLMVVAHTAPAEGIFNVAEYVAMPLFVLAMGSGLWLAWERLAPDAVRFGVITTVRGVLLVILGYALDPVYEQVSVILQSLGLVTVVGAWLVPLCARGIGVAVGMALTAWIASPHVIAWASTMAGGEQGWERELFELIGADPFYRGITMLAHAFAGVATAQTVGWLRRRRSILLLVMGLFGAVVVAIQLVLRGRNERAIYPYAGTMAERAHNLLLAVLLALACVWLLATIPSVRRWLGPLIDTGRMALSAYVLQLVVLRLLTDLVLEGGADDHWWVLLTTVAVLVLASWAWRRTGRIGPVEWLLRWPTRQLDRSWQPRQAAS